MKFELSAPNERIKIVLEVNISISQNSNKKGIKPPLY
jgi:hypothetical protein